jgi:hypothetical protein
MPLPPAGLGFAPPKRSHLFVTGLRVHKNAQSTSELDNRALTDTGTAEKSDDLGPPGESHGTEAERQATTHEDVVAEARQTMAELTHSERKDTRAGPPREQSNEGERGSFDAITVDYVVHRMTIPTGMAMPEFRARFEDAVPHLPLDQVRELVSRGAPWGEMIDLVGRTAPWGFLLYWTNDVDPIVRLAGDSDSAVAYLMGNHTIMERMFRYEPAVVMYAPLHVAIWSHSDGQAFFTVDKPSDQFGSFANPSVTAVGYELDSKLGALLAHLGLRVPDTLAGGFPLPSRGH